MGSALFFIVHVTPDKVLNKYEKALFQEKCYLCCRI